MQDMYLWIEIKGNQMAYVLGNNAKNFISITMAIFIEGNQRSCVPWNNPKH